MFELTICDTDQLSQLSNFKKFVQYTCNNYFNNLHIHRVNEYVTEMLRFLYIKSIHKDVIPPKGIDELLRILLLFPVLYEQICHSITTSNIIDYDPTETIFLYKEESNYNIVATYNIILYNIIYPSGFIVKSLWSGDTDEVPISSSRVFPQCTVINAIRNNKRSASHLESVDDSKLSEEIILPIDPSTIAVTDNCITDGYDGNNNDEMIDEDILMSMKSNSEIKKQRRCSNCYSLGHNFRSCQGYPKIEVISVIDNIITYTVGMSITSRNLIYTYLANTKIKPFLKEYALQHNYNFNDLQFLLNNQSIDPIIKNNLSILTAKDIITVQKRIIYSST